MASNLSWTGIKTGLPLSLFYSPKDAKSSNGGKRFNCGGMGSIEILLRPRNCKGMEWQNASGRDLFEEGCVKEAVQQF
ncbi:hypothetical protein CMV_010919 [Castanea mollissima]|uniref:Uncharacterized protein n=1 Tax=Castanea mollissima TaxID=60419 RepID=A0A8J4RID7_9ROSI|nr:hypothetical protein CMV_010919 [Castanea mollissima]